MKGPSNIHCLHSKWFVCRIVCHLTVLDGVVSVAVDFALIAQICSASQAFNAIQLGVMILIAQTHAGKQRFL